MLADALVAAGDPRGEFIQLQMARSPTDAMVRRANELLTEHGATWSAGFAGAPVEYRGGFPYRVMAHVVDPARMEWATVQELEYSGVGELGQLLARAPLMHSLHVRSGVIAQLEDRGPYPAIRMIAGGGWLPKDRRAFPNLSILAGRFFWHAGALEGLHAAQARARELGLDAVVHYCMPHVPDQVANIVRVRGYGPAETRCAIVSDAGGLVHHGWYARTWQERDAAIVGFHASGWFETETARRVIEPMVAEGIRRIAFAIPIAQRARGAKQLAVMFDELRRQGIEIGEASPLDVLAPATVAG